MLHTILKNTGEKMDLKNILARFPDRKFVLYGGKKTDVSLLEKYGEVLIWFTEKVDDKSTPVQQIYSKFLKTLQTLQISTIFVFMGHGGINGIPAEEVAQRICTKYKTFCIFEGKKEFSISIGNKNVFPLSVEKYVSGFVVGFQDPRIEILQRLSSALKQKIKVTVPFSSLDNSLLPYVHLLSRIEEEGKIPYTEKMPLETIISSPLRIPYSESKFTSAVHWGQRKLLLCEIEGIIECIKKSPNTPFTLLYIGAAPGTHIPYLIELFDPYIKSVHLWDRRERFSQQVRNHPKISIIPSLYEDPMMTGEQEGFFTDVVAEKYQKSGDNEFLILISDIRDKASEEAVEADMRLQENWVLKLQPFASHLKFRLPFLGTEENYIYIDGRIFTQPWARVKSSETRLLSFRPFIKKEYNIQEYDEILAYYNTYTRMSSYSLGAIVDRTMNTISGIGPYIPSEEGFCTCGDCAREIQILSKYFLLMGIEPTEEKFQEYIKRNNGDGKRTLWNTPKPKVGPGDRKDKVIPAQDLLSLNIRSTGNIILSEENLSDSQIEAILKEKKVGEPYFATNIPREDLLSAILKGARFPLVVDFHTDFTKNYDPKKDLGDFGAKKYNHFLQRYALTKMEPGLLMRLFALTQT